MKAKLTEITPAVEAASTKGIDAAVSDLKDGVAKATANFETTQAKVKEGMEKAMQRNLSPSARATLKPS